MSGRSVKLLRERHPFGTGDRQPSELIKGSNPNVNTLKSAAQLHYEPELITQQAYYRDLMTSKATGATLREPILKDPTLAVRP